MPRQIYTAEPRTANFTHTLRAMWHGLIESRYMGYRLAVRSIKARYAKSAFGVFWDLVDPLVLGLIFYGLMIVRVIQPGEMPMPYAIFIIYGLLIYATFVEALTQSLDLFRNSKGLLTQLKIPPEALLISVALSVGFNALFRLVVMLAFSIALHSYAIEHGLSSLSLPGFVKFLALFPMVILGGMSIGLLLAPFNAIYSDVGRVTRIVLNPLRYVSPVLWPLPTAGMFGVLHYVNPLSPLVEDLRLLAVTNTMATPYAFWGWCGASLGMMLAGWFLFHVSVPVLAEGA